MGRTCGEPNETELAPIGAELERLAARTAMVVLLKYVWFRSSSVGRCSLSCTPARVYTPSNVACAATGYKIRIGRATQHLGGSRAMTHGWRPIRFHPLICTLLVSSGSSHARCTRPCGAGRVLRRS